MSVKDRLSVLKLALLTFDHDIVSVHDELCNAGVLVLLMRCLQRATTDSVINWDEAHQICLLMEMAYRCSDDAAVDSIRSIGTEQIILLLNILIQDDVSKECHESIQALFNRISSLEIPLLAFEQSSELIAFVQHSLRFRKDNESIARQAMRMLASLTKDVESQLYVMRIPTFLDCILSCSQAALGAELRLEVAKVLQNLTLHPNNKSSMINHVILEQLIGLAATYQTTETRLEAISALKNLSVEVKGKTLLSSFCGGKAVKTLIRAANHPVLRKLAMETLLNLVCYQTTSLMCDQSGLVELMLGFAWGENADVAEKAAHFLKRIATHISACHKAHPSLFDAILSLSKITKNWRVRFWATKAFLEQSKLSGSSFVLVRSPEALTELCILARDKHVEIQVTAVETLLILTTSHSNMRRIATNTGLLETFVYVIGKCSVHKEEEIRSIGRMAVLAILHLTIHRSAFKRAAKHNGVVSSLSRYGMSDDHDEELKKAALHGVILLAPQM